MLTEPLEEFIQKEIDNGFEPFFVNGTVGTMALNAFDSIETLSKICKTYKLWLHVDGAYCYGSIFSTK